jgi:hypothetical protein
MIPENTQKGTTCDYSGMPSLSLYGVRNQMNFA